MSKAYRCPNLFGEDLKFCFDFEGKLESIRIMNIVGNCLNEKSRRRKKELESYIKENGNKYSKLTRFL
jgi:hypothetical protein